MTDRFDTLHYESLVKVGGFEDKEEVDEYVDLVLEYAKECFTKLFTARDIARDLGMGLQDAKLLLTDMVLVGLILIKVVPVIDNELRFDLINDQKAIQEADVPRSEQLAFFKAKDR